MGYECPVCEIPQADGGHLANHLAFTALIHSDEHESWLDEHVPEWDELGEAELADALTEMAPETDFPQVFEDTTTDSTDHDHERSGQLFNDTGADQRQGREQHVGTDAPLDAQAAAVLEEARRLTRSKRNDDGT